VNRFLQSRVNVLPPDPILEQIKQLPPHQPRHVPLDVEILSDRFIR